MRTGGAQVLWVISELYFPETTSTGRFLTGIAEGLASIFDVRVLCAQPTYSARGVRAPRSEVHGGVVIHRCRSTTLDKNNVLQRAINIVTITSSMFVAALVRLKRGDLVLVVTNPPLLPYFVLLAAKVRGARTILLVHDVYPEVLTAAGMLTSGSWLERIIRRISRLLFHHVEHIVVLGRDMREVVLGRGGELGEKVTIIPNWGEVDRVRPRSPDGARLRQSLGLEAKFVVQYLGNMGRTHALDLLLDAAALLVESPDIQVILCGDGARRLHVEQRIRTEQLHNVTLLPPCSQAELPAHLDVCDVAVIPMIAGMVGVSVPSRLYNVMAAGKPVIAVCDEASELCRVVREEDIGWTFPTSISPVSLAAAIREGYDGRSRLRVMGERARHAAEARYSQAHVTRAFHELLSTLSEHHAPAR